MALKKFTISYEPGDKDAKKALKKLKKFLGKEIGGQRVAFDVDDNIYIISKKESKKIEKELKEFEELSADPLFMEYSSTVEVATKKGFKKWKGKKEKKSDDSAEPVCKGSILLGTGCGKCKKCKAEMKAHQKRGA